MGTGLSTIKKLFLVVTLIMLPMHLPAQTSISELAPMTKPIEEVEALMASGTFSDGEFSASVSNQEAVTFANTIKNKLRKAKSEYTRLPTKIRKSKEADTQWYRMDALLKTSKGFSKALQKHARVQTEQKAPAVAVPETSTAATTTSSATTSPKRALTPQALERKQAAEARAAAMRIQQEKIRAKAAAAKVEKAKAAMATKTGSDWQNSYIPNIKEIQSANGFFQWPWSAPSWKAVTEKALEEQGKGKLSSTQVALFKDFILGKADEWPTEPRVNNAGDARYALDMIRKRESTDGLKVVDLWISRADWKIQRNALGVILYRTKPGYLLYRDPSGEGCILKQLWIKEPYAGGSNYEKASKWRYARLRFQSCDRR